MSILLSVALATVLAVVLFSAAPSLSKLFIKKSDPDAKSIEPIASNLLYIVAATQLPDTMHYSCVAALRGLDDLTFGMLVSLTCIVMLTLGAGACFDFALGAKRTLLRARFGCGHL